MGNNFSLTLHKYLLDYFKNQIFRPNLLSVNLLLPVLRILLCQIPFPDRDLLHLAHLSGREVKMLLSLSVGCKNEPSLRHNGYLVKVLETFNIGDAGRD